MFWSPFSPFSPSARLRFAAQIGPLAAESMGLFGEETLKWVLSQ